MSMFNVSSFDKAKVSELIDEAIVKGA